MPWPWEKLSKFFQGFSCWLPQEARQVRSQMAIDPISNQSTTPRATGRAQSPADPNCEMWGCSPKQLTSPRGPGAHHFRAHLSDPTTPRHGKGELPGPQRAPLQRWAETFSPFA